MTDESKLFHVVVFRALEGLGDTLCVVPALRLLRRSLPNARITYLGLDHVARTVQRYREYVDDFVAFPGWPGIPEASERPDFERLEECRFADIVIQLHGDGSISNGFCASLAPQRIAACGSVIAPAGCRVDTMRFNAEPNEVMRCLRLSERAVRLCGEPPEAIDTTLEFPITGADRSAAERCRTRLGFSGMPFAVVHPGASSAERQWPAERFAEVGRALVSRGLTAVVTGSADERSLAWHTARLIGRGAIVAAGELSLGAMAALLSSASGCITNDTGISHLASAMKTPSVVVFTASDPARWAPLSGSMNRSVWRKADDEDAGPEQQYPLLEPPSVDDALSALASLGIAT